MHILQEMRDRIQRKREEKRAQEGRSRHKRLKQEVLEIVVPPEIKGEIIELSD